jgi:hypothetical protein
VALAAFFRLGFTGDDLIIESAGKYRANVSR